MNPKRKKREPYHTVDGNVNSYSHYRIYYGGPWRNQNFKHDSAIPHLSIYPKKTKTQKDIFSPVFTEALFTRAKIRRQLKYPINEWIKKMKYVNTMEYYTATWKWKSLSHVWLFATPWTIQSMNSPGQNTGVGSLSLFQGIFPTQGLNPGLPHCRWFLHQLSHNGSPL